MSDGEFFSPPEVLQLAGALTTSQLTEGHIMFKIISLAALCLALGACGGGDTEETVSLNVVGECLENVTELGGVTRVVCTASFTPPAACEAVAVVSYDAQTAAGTWASDYGVRVFMSQPGASGGNGGFGKFKREQSARYERALVAGNPVAVWVEMLSPEGFSTSVSGARLAVSCAP